MLKKFWYFLLFFPRIRTPFENGTFFAIFWPFWSKYFLGGQKPRKILTKFFFWKKQIFSLFYNIKSSFSWKWRVKSKIPDPGEFCMALNSYEKNFGTFYPFFQKVSRAFWQHTKKAYFYLFSPIFGVFFNFKLYLVDFKMSKKKSLTPGSFV